MRQHVYQRGCTKALHTWGLHTGEYEYPILYWLCDMFFFQNYHSCKYNRHRVGDIMNQSTFRIPSYWLSKSFICLCRHTGEGSSAKISSWQSTEANEAFWRRVGWRYTCKIIWKFCIANPEHHALHQCCPIISDAVHNFQANCLGMFQSLDPIL